MAPPPSVRGARIRVDGVTILGDGRVRAIAEVDALLTPRGTRASATWRDFDILRLVDGRYLIDAVTLAVGTERPGGDDPRPAGTPAS